MTSRARPNGSHRSKGASGKGLPKSRRSANSQGWLTSLVSAPIVAVNSRTSLVWTAICLVLVPSAAVCRTSFGRNVLVLRASRCSAETVWSATQVADEDSKRHRIVEEERFLTVEDLLCFFSDGVTGGKETEHVSCWRDWQMETQMTCWERVAIISPIGEDPGLVCRIPVRSSCHRQDA